jgi:hypothetical protein
MRPKISDVELAQWAEQRADDAGHLARELILYRQAGTPPPSTHVLPIELNGVSAALDNGKGLWRTCTGCHESNEGFPTGPYSTVMKCHLGGGCFECGGIGAIWDTTDYEDMGNALAEQAIAEAKQPDHRHDFVPHKKYPWFCACCGYAPHEPLKHFQPTATTEGKDNA